MSMLLLPLDVLGKVLALDCLLGVPTHGDFVYENVHYSRVLPFTERAGLFYKDLPTIFRGHQTEEDKQIWLNRRRFTLTYDPERVVELALTCKTFWRAMKKVWRLKQELFRTDVRISLWGSSFDGDCYPYFPARFCSQDSERLKEVVDTINRNHIFIFQFVFLKKLFF
jgi:hypothetical protein